MNVGIFGFMKKNSMDINEGVRRLAEEPGAVLLDVREPQEFAAGHIPGSVNLPLAGISNAGQKAPDTTAPIYVYCLSGGRSARAAAALRDMGYANVTDLGGISAYKGRTER